MSAVDDAAVQRAINGDRDVPLNTLDRIAAVQRLRAKGESHNAIADRLGLDKAQVNRDLNADPVESIGGGGPPMRASHPITELRRIPLELLDGHPANVREVITDESIVELADSIRSVGLLQPLVVAAKPDGRYEILAGHRRHAALCLTREQSAPCVVRTRRPERAEALEVMLVENLHRRALNPIEEAEAYQALVNLGQTQTAIAGSVARSITHVSQRLSLLLLPHDQQRAIARHAMSITDAYQLARRVRESQGRRHGLTGTTRHPSARGIAWARGQVPHFNHGHPLAAPVAQRCEEAKHPRVLRIGPGCGECWEATIRDDAAVDRQAAAS